MYRFKVCIDASGGNAAFLLHFLVEFTAMQCPTDSLRDHIETAMKKLEDIGIVTYQDHAEQEGFWSFALRVQCLLVVSGEWDMAKELARGLPTWGVT